MNAASTHTWRRAARELERLGLFVDDAYTTPDGTLAWSDETDGVVIPTELPSSLGALTAESIAVGTGLGFIQTAHSYVMRNGHRLVLVREQIEEETTLQAWVTDDSRGANWYVNECVASWLRIGWKVTAYYADGPEVLGDATSVRRALDRVLTKAFSRETPSLQRWLSGGPDACRGRPSSVMCEGVAPGTP